MLCLQHAIPTACEYQNKYNTLFHGYFVRVQNTDFDIPPLEPVILILSELMKTIMQLTRPLGVSAFPLNCFPSQVKSLNRVPPAFTFVSSATQMSFPNHAPVSL